MRRSRTQLLLALPVLLAVTGCASARVSPSAPASRLAVLTPLDGVPVRTRDVLTADRAATDLAPARAAVLLGLRGDLAHALEDAGASVVLADLPALTGKPLAAPAAAALGRAAGADLVLESELVVYGDIRKSWIGILFAQGLLAGIGHGVVVAAATGNSTYGWWAGGLEFATETVTWVGGALVGTRGIDPVFVRFTLVRAADARVVARWSREGTRPVRRWFRRKGEPPRDERLRVVADRLFERFAPKLLRRLARGR